MGKETVFPAPAVNQGEEMSRISKLRHCQGIYEIVEKNGRRYRGYFISPQPVDWGAAKKFFETIFKLPNVDTRKSFLARFDPKRKRMVALLGKLKIYKNAFPGNENGGDREGDKRTR